MEGEPQIRQQTQADTTAVAGFPSQDGRFGCAERLRAKGCKRQGFIATRLGELVYARLGFPVVSSHRFSPIPHSAEAPLGPCRPAIAAEARHDSLTQEQPFWRWQQ